MRGGAAVTGGVLCVLGTRPEAIKLAPVVTALAARGIAVTLCNTGQHRDLARTALAELGMAIDVDLDLMTPSQTPAAFASAVLPPLTATLAHVAPRLVVVQGDTATTFAAALAASYARIPVAHVEAGLRSNAAEPFPEDMHRRLIAQLACRHFAPTAGAAAALAREGIAEAAITVTGNTGIDAVHRAAARVTDDGALREAVSASLPRLRPGRPLVLVTAHRRENHAHMPRIAAAIAALASARDVDIILPLHPHPAAGAVLDNGLAACANVIRVPPLGHHAFVTLLGRARLVITDSGGVQEEAPAFGTPVLVLRETTERPEGVAAGAAQLVGTDPQRIVAAALRLIDDDAAHAAMAAVVLPYGDGHAAARIADILAAKVARIPAATA